MPHIIGSDPSTCPPAIGTSCGRLIEVSPTALADNTDVWAFPAPKPGAWPGQYSTRAAFLGN